MVRNKLVELGVGLPKQDSRDRGVQVSRVEGFSDAVFAFSITLLIVSLQVPHTFDELVGALKGCAAFAICFAMIAFIWFEHYRFFRRYALQDTLTIIINSALLFVVLIYVYPLKFLFTLVVRELGTTDPVAHSGALDGKQMILAEQVPKLFIVYGLGFVAIFGLFALLYAHAAALRDRLELSPGELFEARAKVAENAGTALIGVVSVLLATYTNTRFGPFYAGSIYLLLPVHYVAHRLAKARIARGLVANSNQNLVTDEGTITERAASDAL